MAKFRRFRKKTRSFFRGMKKRGRSMAKGQGVMATALSAGLYGVGRAPVASAISPLSSKLPFGAYNDEAAMIGLCILGQRFAPNGVIKNALRAGMIVEIASLASQATAGMTQGTSTATNAPYVYG